MPEQPSHDIVENARQWLAYADEDMDLAQHARSHIAARYPGLDEQVSEDDASRAIEIAERVRDAVHERLVQLGV